MEYMDCRFEYAVSAVLKLSWGLTSKHINNIRLHYCESRVDHLGTPRSYHNWDHILTGFKDIFEYFHGNPEQQLNKELIFAWLYHDYVYKTDGTDNELESFKAAKLNTINPSYLAGMKNLWLCTKHNDTAITQDEKLICDVDLAVLGDWWESFTRTNRAIELEWAAYSRLELLKGRKEFFEKLLARRNIYYLDYFYHRYESQARCNIERLLKEYDKELRDGTRGKGESE